MQLRFGQYRFPVGQVEATPRLRTLRNQAGIVYENQWSIQVKGNLLASDPDSSTAALELSQNSAIMRVALANPDSDLVLIDNYGNPTDIYFPRASSISGVQVDWVQYPDTEPGSLVTHRPFEFQATVQYPAVGLPNPLIEYEESVDIIGTGGPAIVLQPALNTRPVAVAVQRYSVVRAIVTGRAVGYRGYPAVPPPLFSGPGIYLMNPETAISRGGPKYRGRGFTDFPVSWRYVFAADRPLSGLPRVWGGRGNPSF